MAKLTEDIHLRLTKKQLHKVRKLAERVKISSPEVIRRAIDVVTSDDQVVVPLTVKERLFIEGICDTAGVQPSEAVKIVLLSYHTLMSSPLWKIVKPVNEILDEMKVETE